MFLSENEHYLYKNLCKNLYLIFRKRNLLASKHIFAQNKNETPSFSSDLKSIIYQHSFMLYSNNPNLITRRKEKRWRRWTLRCSKMCKNCCFSELLSSSSWVSSFVSFNLFHTLIQWWISFYECEKFFFPSSVLF